MGSLAGRIFPALAVCAAFALVVPGCSEIERHAVLEFFFDGVPPYRTPEERARLAAEAKVKAEKDAAKREEAARLAAHGIARRRPQFEHGPYAAGECERCHDFEATSGFAKASGRFGDFGSGSGGGEPGRLKMTVQKLCIRCHDFLDPRSSVNEGLWMHGPVASGWCIACHDAHTSPNPKLLLREPSANLCTQCHLRRDLLAFVPEHKPADPLRGWPRAKNKAPPKKKPVVREAPLLPGADVKAEAVSTVEPPPEPEWEIPDEQVVENCVRCHNPHRGRDRFLLRDKPLPRRRSGLEDAPTLAALDPGFEKPSVISSHLSSTAPLLPTFSGASNAKDGSETADDASEPLALLRSER